MLKNVHREMDMRDIDLSTILDIFEEIARHDERASKNGEPKRRYMKPISKMRKKLYEARWRK